jgi:putative hydrolase of the HAD superfamily
LSSEFRDRFSVQPSTWQGAEAVTADLQGELVSDTFGAVVRSIPRMLKAILFDAAGTLIFLPRGVGEHYGAVAAGLGVSLDPAELDRAFRHAWKIMPPRAATPDGSPRPDDDKSWWRELVRRVLAEVMPAGDARRDRFEEETYFETVYAHFAKPGIWAPFPEALAVLTSLRKKGFELAVVSNFDRRLLPVLKDVGLAQFFRHVILSSEVGADKPDPRIFLHALDVLGVAPAEALHVGDDPERDWAADRCGIPVFQLRRPQTDLRDLLVFIERST